MEMKLFKPHFQKNTTATKQKQSFYILYFWAVKVGKKEKRVGCAPETAEDKHKVVSFFSLSGQSV